MPPAQASADKHHQDQRAGEPPGLDAELTASLKTTLDTILSSIRQLVPYDIAEITLWDEERQCCVTQGWGGDRRYALEKGGTYYIDEGYTGWIIRHRQFLLVRDVQARRDVRPRLDTPDYPFLSYVGLPLEIRGRFVGTLELADCRRDVWRERDLEILRAIANQAAVAIENAYLYAATRRHAAQQAGLARIAALASSTLDLDELLDRVMGETIRLLNAERGLLMLYDEQENALIARYLASSEAEQAGMEGFKVPASAERFGETLFARGGSCTCDNLAQDADVIPAYRAYMARTGIHNFAGVALRLKEHSIGELYLGNRRGGFGTDEVQTLQAIAGYIASAIENARLYAQTDEELRRREESLRRRNRELTTLYEAATTIGASLSLDAVLRTVSDQMMKLLNVTGCSLYQWNREQDTLETLMDYVPAGQTSEPAGTIYRLSDYPATRRVLETRQPLVVRRDDPLADPAERALMERWGMCTLLMLPLIARDRVFGLLELSDTAETGEFTPEEVRLAESLAAQAAIAIENARLYEQAQQEIADRARVETALQRLQRVSHEVNATLDSQHILNLVIEEAVRQSGATHGAIMLLDIENGVLRLGVCTGYTEPEKARIEAFLQSPDDHPTLAESLRAGNSLFIPDLTEREGAAGFGTDTRSLLTVPIFYQGGVAGLIVLESAAAGAFDQATLGFVEGLSSQAAMSIGNAQRYQEQLARGELLRRRADRLTAVLEVSRALRSDRPLEEILEEVAYAIQESVGFNLVIIGILEGDPPYRRRVAAAGLSLADFERLKQVREPWSTVADLMTAEYRISRSYYIPAEKQAAWRGRLQVYEQESGNGVERRPGYWHPHDLLLVPLVGPGGDIQGLLSVDQPLDGRVPDMETIGALEIFAAQAALAIENARLMEASVRRAETLALFNEVSRAITTHLETVELGQLLNTVAGMIPRLLPSDLVQIFLLDSKSGQYAPRASYGVPLAEIETLRFAPGVGFVGEAARSGMPLIVDDVAQDMRASSIQAVGEMKSAVLTPLTVGNQVVGVLCVGRRAGPAFSMNEAATLSTLADQMAVAVANVRLFNEVRRFSQELEQRVEERTQELAEAMQKLAEERDWIETLYRITSRLSANLDLDYVLNQALQLIIEAVGAERASVMLLGEDGRWIDRLTVGGEVRTPPGGRYTRFSREEGLVGWIVTHRQAVLISDLRQDLRWAAPRSLKHEYRSALGVPLLSSEQELGVLLLFHSQPNYFSESHRLLVETAAIQIANTIHNIELYRLIVEQSEKLGNMLKAQQVEAAKSQAILEGVADGVIVTDADGKIILFNAAAERILDMPREHVLGRMTSEMPGLYGKQARSWMATLNRWAKERGAYDTADYLADRFDIRDRVVSVHLAPVLMGDETGDGAEREFLGAVSVFRDVTAEVAAERAKTEFVSTVSHELRTPMTSIKGYVKLLLMEVAGTLADEQRRFLSIVDTNVERLTVLVNDLLDISRIESGRLVISPRVIQPADVIRQVTAEMQARAINQRLTLRAETPPLPHIFADPDRVAQILTNLVANACNYTLPGGKVTVTASANGNEVYISVADTGIGISPENQKRIFDRFFRADDDVVQEAPGTGLGLSIVQSLVEMQGGRVWVESELGVGSTFTFTMPIARDGEGGELES